MLVFTGNVKMINGKYKETREQVSNNHNNITTLSLEQPEAVRETQTMANKREARKQKNTKH